MKIRSYQFWQKVLWAGLMVGSVVLMSAIKKDSLMKFSYEYLPNWEAGLLNGIVWGQKEELGYWNYQSFIKSGIAHVVVASGANVMLIAGTLIESLAWVLGRKKSIIWGLVWGWWYAYTSGFNPPVVRAVLMVSYIYWAQLLGRIFTWRRAVLWIVFLMCLSNTQLVLSMSFWMSVVASVAVGIYGNLRLKRRFFLVEEFRKTVWVSLWLLPFTIFIFKRMAWLSPVANSLVFLLVNWIMGWGMLGGIIGQVWPWGGGVVLAITYYPLTWVLLIGRWLGG